MKDPKNNSVNRRGFLQSAAAGGLAMAAVGTLTPARRIAGDRTIRVGLIGRDGHTGMVLSSIPRLRQVELVAAAKARPQDDVSSIQSNPAFTERTRIFEDYLEMLEKEELDIAGVCVPLYRSAEISIEAARRGIHVVCEKPAATTLADLSRLQATVEKSGIRYSIMLSMRTNPAFQAVRQAVQQGLIGEPFLLYSQKSYQWDPPRPWYYRERQTYGGSIPWIGIHAIDSMRWASGQEYIQVAAHHGNKTLENYPGCEDHAGILYKLANGGSAVCNLDYLRPQTAASHGDDRLRIAGAEGVVEVVGTEDRALIMTRSSGLQDLELPAPVDFFATFVAELRGEGTHIVSNQEAIGITRVCLLTREAADTGQWLALL